MVVLSTQPTDAQFSGSAAGGQTRAVVDAEGRLVELTVDALLLRRPPRGVAEAILSAVQQAQDAAARSLAADASAGPADDAADTFDPARLAADVAAAEREADRRLSELSAIVSDLIRHQDRRP